MSFRKLLLKKHAWEFRLLQSEEGTHGLMCSGGTIFPEGLAIGSTWNMDLVNNIYTIAAQRGPFCRDSSDIILLL